MFNFATYAQPIKTQDIENKAAASEQASSIEQTWVLNTSNKGKLQEFERIFAKHGASIIAKKMDLHEIQADPVTVAVHKASQLGEGILVEDTSLDVVDADIGVNVRWLLDNLSKYEGKKAVWRVLLAYQKKDLVYVYEGKINGTIVKPRDEQKGFGFDPVFLPEGSEYTLSQEKPDDVNARSKAVEALFQDNPLTIQPPIMKWDGEWQN